MNSRDEILARAVTPSRADRAHSEAAAFTVFRERLGLADSRESIALYLAALFDAGLSGARLSERLSLVDLDRRVRGLSPWRGDADVRALLQGIHAARPLGDRSGHYDPLYGDLVQATVDACRAPAPDQRRMMAAHLLRLHAGVSAACMTRLRWRDVRLTKGTVEFAVTTKVGRGATTSSVVRVSTSFPGDPQCPVAALRALRSLDGGEYVFGTAGKPLDVNRLGRWLASKDPRQPTPAQMRDPALLLVGFAAGLRTGEALALRQRDVRRHDRGLVISIAGRKRLTFVPSSPNPAYDPAVAWAAWLDLLDDCGLRHPDGPVAHATSFGVILDRPLSDAGLNGLVHRRSAEAGLRGRYVWTSLRTGMMRSAIRSGVRPHTVAAHADLVALGSVERHQRREELLGARSVAAQLGL